MLILEHQKMLKQILWQQGLDEKIYIQVAYILSDDTVIDREFNAYKKIEDNYPKYVLSMDKFDLSQNGIIHKNIIDWLLKRQKKIKYVVMTKCIILKR